MLLVRHNQLTVQKPSRWLNPVGVLFFSHNLASHYRQLRVGRVALQCHQRPNFLLSSCSAFWAHGFSLHGFHLCIYRGQPLHLSLFKKKEKDKVAYWQNLPPFRKLPKQHHPETSAFSWKCVTWPFPAPPDASTNCVHHHPEQNGGSIGKLDGGRQRKESARYVGRLNSEWSRSLYNSLCVV